MSGRVGHRLSEPVPFDFAIPTSPPHLSPVHHHQQPPLSSGSYGWSPRSVAGPHKPQPGRSQGYGYDATVTTPPSATRGAATGYRQHAPPQLQCPSTRAWTSRRSPLNPMHPTAYDDHGVSSHPSTSASSASLSDDVGSGSVASMDEDMLGSGSSGSTGTGSAGTDGWRARHSGWTPSGSPEDTKRQRQHSGDSTSSGGSWGPGPEAASVAASVKRQRFASEPVVGVNAVGGAGQPPARRPSVTSGPVGAKGRFRNGSISNAAVGAAVPASSTGTPGAPPLAGSFATPNRATLLRRDSLKASPASSSGAPRLRMDNGAMKALGYPRAPAQRKLDTPVGEYDGTPLGVGLGGFGAHDGLREALGRKGSQNRLLMDEGLANALEMGGNRLPSSKGSMAWGGLSRKTSRAGMSALSPRLDRRDVGSGLQDVAMDDVPHEPPTWQHRDRSMDIDVVKAAELAEQQRRQVDDMERRHPAKPLARLQLDDLDRRHNGPSSASLDSGYGSYPTSARPSMIDVDGDVAREAGVAAAAAPSRPRFVPSPSNRRMGFSSEEAKEVVPWEPSSGAFGQDGLLSICVLAVESIWPDNRPANWTYEKSLNGGRRPAPPAQGVLPLSTFVKEVLRRSRTSPHTLHVALFYLHQSRRAIREKVALGEKAKIDYDDEMAKRVTRSGSGSTLSTPGLGLTPEMRLDDVSTIDSPGKPDLKRIVEAMSDPVLCGRRTFLASLMCASKYLQDRNYSNRAWAKISGLPVKEVNSNERSFLALVQYKLHVEVETFERWIARLQKLSDDKSAADAASPVVVKSATSTPSTAPSSWATESSRPINSFASAVTKAASPHAATGRPSIDQRVPIKVPATPSKRSGGRAPATRVQPPSISRPSAHDATPRANHGAQSRYHSGSKFDDDGSSVSTVRPGRGGYARRPAEVSRLREDAQQQQRRAASYDAPPASRDFGLRDRFASTDYGRSATYANDDDDFRMDPSNSWRDRPSSASSCGLQESGRNTPIGGLWAGPTQIY